MDFVYRQANLGDLERIWEINILDNPDDKRWIDWKNEAIDNNKKNISRTFVILCDGVPIGEGTLLFSPKCRAVAGRTQLADNLKVANINALRIQKSYEGKGHISNLMHIIEKSALEMGYTHLTIGVEARETRNLAIYLHWGYDKFVLSEVEDGALVLYYSKTLSTR